MSFLTPLFLLGLATLAVPVLIHLTQKERKSVVAFARPFLRGTNVAAAAGGARDIVVVLDRSYSMGYADTWSRAQKAAIDALSSTTPADRISLVLFADTAEVAVRSTPDRSRAIAEINATQPGPGATKFGPAI